MRAVPLFGGEGVDQLSLSLSQANIEPVKRGDELSSPFLSNSCHSLDDIPPDSEPSYFPHSFALEIALPAESRVARSSRAGGASPTSPAISIDTGLYEAREPEEEISCHGFFVRHL